VLNLCFDDCSELRGALVAALASSDWRTVDPEGGVHFVGSPSSTRLMTFLGLSMVAYRTLLVFFAESSPHLRCHPPIIDVLAHEFLEVRRWNVLEPARMVVIWFI
jgi:hypothetical protein